MPVSLNDWPDGLDPKTIGGRVVAQFRSAEPEAYAPKGFGGESPAGGGKYVCYAVASLWVNALEFARVTGDSTLEKSLVGSLEPFLPNGRKSDRVTKPRHVDFNVFGAVPLEAAILTGRADFLQLGLRYADDQWEEPRADDLADYPKWLVSHYVPVEKQRTYLEAGYSGQTRLWIDDMYMINLLQTQAFRATEDRKYVLRAAKEMRLYLDKLQLEDGLFNHAAGVPFRWGRGNGWMAAGMPLVLRHLKPTDADFAPILAGYRKMMATLLRYQRESGLWGQLVDDPRSWEETSGSLMFAYGFILGCKMGWLDAATYAPAARKAYLAVASSLDAYGNVPNVCCGTGAENSREYYYQREKINGDPHGQAPLLWCCVELVDSIGTAAIAGGTNDPLFRVGWISDTHTGTTRESFGLVEKAMKLFREQNVDAVINNGDISDHYYPTGYPIYRQVMDEAFAGAAKKPLEIYAWAWHDAYEWNGPRVRESNEAQRKACYADVAKRLGIRHGMADRFEINGYIFILFPQWTGDAEWHGKKGEEAYELILQEAERDCGGKPIFVIDHVPPSATVANSITWGSGWRRDFYARHPGIISLSGHTHGSLRDENLIWQGAFTAVNAGCLQVWEGDSVGLGESSKRSYGAIVIEGFEDRIVFRRFDVRDGTEYRRHDPWTVPWPFDPKTAPYSFERRAKTTPVPEFAADAKVAVRANEPFTGFTLALPPVASGADLAYRYRVSVAERTADGWRDFKTVEKYTQFYLRPSERRSEVPLSFSAGYFADGRRYRFEVAPVNFFGVAGKPVFAEATAPRGKPAKLLWASAKPMEELKFVYGDDGTDDGKPVERKDGWYLSTGAPARLVLPAQAWKAPKGTRLRFTVDLETVQNLDPEARTYNVSLMRLKPNVETACGRIKTLHGESGIQRYVIEFTKGKDIPFSFFVREGLAGKVKFHALKVEEI